MSSVESAKLGRCRVLICSVAGAAALVGCHSGTRIKAADAKTEDVLTAASAGRKGEVGEYLDHGGNVNVADVNGETLLHMAASRGHDGLVEILIGRGAVVNAQDANGNTPLHLAAMNGHSKTIGKLSAAGANRSMKNKEGKTAADVAAAKVKGLVAP